MRLLYGQDEFIAAWVGQRTGSLTGFGQCKAVGIEKDGRLVAGLVWHDYRPQYGSLQMSIAGEGNWCSRKAMEAFFHYPFIQLKCRSVFVCVRADNERSRKFVEKVGFRFSGLLRRGFGTVDALLFDMLSSEVRWLRSSPDERQSSLNSSPA